MEKQNTSSCMIITILLSGMLLIAFLVFGIFTKMTVKKAIEEKTEIYLREKASDIASLIESRIESIFEVMTVLSRIPYLTHDAVSLKEKAAFLQEIDSIEAGIQRLFLVEVSGAVHGLPGTSDMLTSPTWFQEALAGKTAISGISVDNETGEAFHTCAVPIYSGDTVKTLLCARIHSSLFSEMIKGIVIGHTGFCRIIDREGMLIAFPDTALVNQQFNILKEAEENTALQPFAAFVQKAISSDTLFDSCESLWGWHLVAASASLRGGAWKLIVAAPDSEFFAPVRILNTVIVILGGIILLISPFVVFSVVKSYMHCLPKVEAVEG